MTATYLLSLGILAFVLKTGLGTRELDRRRFTLPLAVVAVAGSLFLRSVPATPADIGLIAVLGAAGVLLGLVAGALMKVRRTGDGSLVTVAGTSYAAVWVAAVGGRLAFAYSASHWFAPQIASFSRAAGISGSAAYTAAFVTMALTIVLTRVAVTAVKAARLTADTPLTRPHATASARHGHTHLHSHAY
jgi:hypothetical protein